MPVIRIQEHAKVEDGWQVKVSFDYREEHNATVRNPFSKEDEKDLAWYFEEYPNFPSSKDSDKVEKIAASIKSYGEALFNDIFFKDSDVYSKYSKIRDLGLSDLQIEITGNTPQFHALHWEALKDPKRPLPLTLQATVIRQNLRPSQEYPRPTPSPTINLLIVTARPYGEHDNGYRTISRPLIKILRDERVEIHVLRPGTYRALENHLNNIKDKPDKGKGYYHVIHFDMHGIVCTYEQLQEHAKNYQLTGRYARDSKVQEYEDVKAFLLFESEQDHKADLVSAEELHELLVDNQVPIVVLNACQSGKQVGEQETSLGSWLVQAGVQLVLAMGYSVNVQAAEKLMSVLYSQLLESHDPSIAIRRARRELYNNKKRKTSMGKEIYLEDWLLPIVYQNKPLKLEMPDFTPEQSKDFYQRRGERDRYLKLESFDEFAGRDIDILQIEKRLLTKRNILLVRGIGGIGKTTLFRHLEAWWFITDLIQLPSFYFCYNEKAWTFQEIITYIAQELGLEHRADFSMLNSEEAKRYKLFDELCKLGRRCLLIFDHLEAITGTNLNIQSKLPPNELDALHNFLKQLARGQDHILVLLGSRDSVDQLAKDTFNNNVYDLGGLDFEAAMTLAHCILERNNIVGYQQDEGEEGKEHESLRDLLKLLDGFPLAIEVVLVNLGQQTPSQVLSVLHVGDEPIGVEKQGEPSKLPKERTKIIWHCIEYIYCYLSPEVRQLLLCLAPFKGAVEDSTLILYLPYLQKQHALSNLPFSHWLEMIKETQHRNLLTPNPDTPQILHLQTIFSYLLCIRLDAPEQEKEKQAIKTAFLLLYEQISESTYQQLSSKDPNKNRAGQGLARWECSNLETALDIALKAQVSIFSLFQALFKYLDITTEKEMVTRGLDLAQTVLSSMDNYPLEKRMNSLCRDYIGVIGKVAYQQTILHQYQKAEETYQQMLSLLPQLECLTEHERNKWEADIHHALGNLAFEQNRLPDAEKYYQQALQVEEKLDDASSLVIIYKRLGDLAQQQKNTADANEYYQKAFDLFVKLNDPTLKS
jgi:tetratricopeptide (TPR) repeat protein